jgi:hypothetical protein
VPILHAPKDELCGWFLLNQLKRLSKTLERLYLNRRLVHIFVCHESIKKLILTTLTRGGVNLAKQNEIINDEVAGLHNGNGVSGECGEIKKAFVEPTISVPVDVLEATTFFQSATSNVTN